MNDAKRKELETRALLGPRIGRSKTVRQGPTAPPVSGGPRRRVRITLDHPTRDSG